MRLPARFLDSVYSQLPRQPPSSRRGPSPAAIFLAITGVVEIVSAIVILFADAIGRTGALLVGIILTILCLAAIYVTWGRLSGRHR